MKFLDFFLARRILEGLLGANLIGFHTYDYVFHFFHVSSYFRKRKLPWRNSNRIKANKSWHLSNGYRLSTIFRCRQQPACSKEMTYTLRRIGSEKYSSFDRLDYTKDPTWLEAFDACLKENQKYRGKVSFILVAVPSRINVSQYQTLKKQLMN